MAAAWSSFGAAVSTQPGAQSSGVYATRGLGWWQLEMNGGTVGGDGTGWVFKQWHLVVIFLKVSGANRYIPSAIGLKSWWGDALASAYSISQ